MDPQARHSTWTILQKFKKERQVTILLTTHFMDEVEFKIFDLYAFDHKIKVLFFV